MLDNMSLYNLSRSSLIRVRVIDELVGCLHIHVWRMLLQSALAPPTVSIGCQRVADLLACSSALTACGLLREQGTARIKKWKKGCSILFGDHCASASMTTHL